MARSIFFILAFLSFSASAQQKPISIINKVISIYGRELEINADGFPKQIKSYYDWEFNKFGFKPTNLLYEPIHFHYFTSPKTQERLVISTFDIISNTTDSVVWDATSSSDNISQYVRAKMSEDGFVDLRVRIKALKALVFSTINFHIPFEKNAAKYVVGLGNHGYLRPDTVKWSWKLADKISPTVLIGNDNAALYINIDQSKKSETLSAKNGWRNDDKGKMQVNIKGSSMLTEFSTGVVSLKAGDELTFNFNLLVTPIDRKDGRRDLQKRFNKYHSR